MQLKIVLLSGTAIIASFIGGFLLANGLNKSEIADLVQRNAELEKVGKPAEKLVTSELSEERIETELKRAGERPNDFNLQKSLAFALYRYSIQKDDKKRLSDVERLLSRAHAIHEDDFDVLAALARVVFQLAKFEQKTELYDRSKELFENALKRRPEDIQVLSDFGLTLMESPTPDVPGAIEVFEKAYQVDQMNQETLNHLIKAYLSVGNTKRAYEMITELKEINPQHPLVLDIDNKLKSEETP